MPSDKNSKRTKAMKSPSFVKSTKQKLERTFPLEVGIDGSAWRDVPDPFVEFMIRTRGCLGAHHTLEY